MIRKAVLLAVLAPLTLTATASAAAHHKHHPARRAAVATPTLDLAEAAYAIETQSVKNWNTPGVEAAVSECHYLAHPWEAQCTVTWRDPSWISPTCGALTISGLDNAILEDGAIKVYAT